MFSPNTRYRRINSLSSLDIYITVIHGAFDLHGEKITATVVYVKRHSGNVLKKDGLPFLDVVELRNDGYWEEVV